MPAVFDVWDSATNTELVNRSVRAAIESGPTVGSRFMPLTNTRTDRVKRSIVELAAPGAATVVARHAAPAVWTPELRYSEEWIELVKMDEMSPIEEDEWRKLTEGTEYERNTAGVDIVNRARLLQMRSETKTEIMRWLAVKDELTLQLAESGSTPKVIKVEFDQPPENRPDGSDWTDRENSTPITDLETFQSITFEALSVWAVDIYMSSATWNNLKYSNQVKELLKPVVGSGTDFFIPTKAQVESLLVGGETNREHDRGPNGVSITITDAGYRTEGSYGRGASSKTRYLPDDYVLLVAGPTIEGEKVGEVLNGRVAIRRSATSEPEWVQGPANHTWASLEPPYTHYTRQVCKRIPRVNIPEAFVYAFVGTPES